MGPFTSPTRRVAAGVAVAVLLLAGCAKKSSPTGAGALGGSSVPPTPGATATTTPTVVPSSGGGGGGTGTMTPPHTAGPTGPRIVQFDVKQKPDCPVIAASDAPFAKAGTDIVLEWKVTGATKVALSLDDPDFFAKFQTGSLADYPALDSVDLAFTCDPTVQPDTTHRYTLNTIGGGPTVAKTLTVTVRTSP